MEERSPEYRAISQNRQDLEKHLAQHIVPIAETLRDNEVLSDTQCNTILEANKPNKELVSAILLAVKTDPVRAFWKIIELIKSKTGNEWFQTFIETKVEARRKELYREMIDKCGCDDTQEYDIFISYGREKSTNDQVNKIAEIFHCEGYTVFVDRSSIHIGDLWSATLIGAVRNCRAFVAVLTKKYVTSSFCHGELYEAEAQDKLLYPVVLEGDWEKEKGANPVIKILSARIQYCQLGTQKEFEENLPNLVEAIKAKLGKVKRPLDEPSDPPKKRSRFDSKDSEATDTGSGASTSSTAANKESDTRQSHDVMVKTKIKRLEDAFEELKVATLVCLEKKESNDENFLKKFQDHLVVLSAGSLKQRHAKFFSQKNRALIRCAKSVQPIFDLLSEYINILNCSLLFYIIDHFTDSTTQKIKDNFYSNLQSFRSRTKVSDLRSVWKSHLPSDTAEVTTQYLHETMTLEEVEETKEAIAWKASFQSFILFFGDSSPGSIIISWAIPMHIASLFAVSLEDTIFRSLGIDSVKINGHSLKDYIILFPYVHMTEDEEQEEMTKISPNEENIGTIEQPNKPALGCVTQHDQHIFDSETSVIKNEKPLHLTQKQEQVSKLSDVDMADGTMHAPLEALCVKQKVKTDSEELGKEVSEEDILEMYQKSGKYELVATLCLGLKNPDIEEIEH